MNISRWPPGSILRLERVPELCKRVVVHLRVFFPELKARLPSSVFQSDKLTEELWILQVAILRKLCDAQVPQCCWATKVEKDRSRDTAYCSAEQYYQSCISNERLLLVQCLRLSIDTQETHTLFLALLHSLGKVALPSCSVLASACIKPWCC